MKKKLIYTFNILWIGVSDLTDSFGDLDDSAMDIEGPTLMYRYSRRKSDSKSDENSQNSKCKRFAVSYKVIRFDVRKAIVLF